MDKLHTWFDSERGRQSELARALNVSPSTFSSWKKVPAERVRAVEAFTGIPAHELRSDLFTKLDLPSETAATVSQDIAPSQVPHG